MPDQRKEPREPGDRLPPAFRTILVRTHESSFPCLAVDAGASGLGLVAGKPYQGLITRGLAIQVTLEGFTLDAEVLNIFDTFGPDSFRFGVHLNRYYQLKPYWELLGTGIRA